MSAPARIALLADLYQRYLDDKDPARLIGDVARRYTLGTLERLAVHSLAPTRRAAVLALGFLADYGSNAVLGRRLRDDDRLVRLLAETSIRNVWQRAGSETECMLLRIVIQHNTSERHRDGGPDLELPVLALLCHGQGLLAHHPADVVEDPAANLLDGLGAVDDAPR